MSRNAVAIGTRAKGANVENMPLGNRSRRKDILQPFRIFYSLVPACAARLAPISSAPALVIRPVIVYDGLSSAILFCAHFCVQDCALVHILQRAMDRYSVIGLRVAKHHNFDEVAERQEPLETHRLLKEA